MYKFRKIIGKNDFPYHFKKIIARYKKIVIALRTNAVLFVMSLGRAMGVVL